MLPPEVMLERLAGARRAGRSFEQAWPDALAAALAASGRPDRGDWQVVLTSMVDVWRAAWDRRPAPPRERALSAVAAGRSLRGCRGQLLCDHCRQPIPAGRGRRGAPVRYCSDRCRHAAYDRQRDRRRAAA